MPSASGTPRPPARRRVGRPRANPTPGDLSPRDEILAAATRLFAERGVGDVTMSEIAGRAGLRQASLYYWFRRKEEILAEIVDQVNRVPLEFVLKLEDEAGDPAVQLWRLVRFDVAALCGFPFDINEVHRLSHRVPDAFEVYWQERQALNDAVERLIARGVACGVFRPVDARLAALVVLSDDEGLQNWHRPIDGRRLAGPPDGDYPVAVIADFVADLTLRGLLAVPDDLARVRAEAADL
ncbi:MAG TPA: TetR/AcrR family transcriptional regulator [Acidimicrobiales bacterium]|nr:TetR/AcrR family transcriptional regulator [Acidimicrobiales bacterium]